MEFPTISSFSNKVKVDIKQSTLSKMMKSSL